MPLYEYKCQKCNEVFEVMQRFSDEPLQLHGNCGGTVERLISSPALQFKGSGWYITDYARSGSGKNGKKEGGGGTSESKSGASSSDSKDSGSSAGSTSSTKPANSSKDS